MNEKNKKAFSAIAFCFILFFVLAALNRTGSLILLWKEEPLGSIEHDAGFGHYAFVRDENLSKLGLPFFLKEDDSFPDPGPLSVNEDITASIKELGGGRYQLLENNDLYFSASDGQPEDHEYSIISPAIIRSRWLLLLFAPAALAAAGMLFFCLKTKDPGMIRETARRLSAVLLALLLLPWNRMAFPSAPQQIGPVLFKPLLQRNPLFIILLLICLLISFRRSEKSRIIRGLAVLAVLVNTAYYFIPEWNWFGVRADSGAYIQKYDATSIRTPGYPVFIETVYRLNGNDGLESVRNEIGPQPDESLQDGRAVDSRGLLNVTRAQKCVLAAAFLTLFAVFCRFYGPVWFAFAAQIILCSGFLGVDNSYIMTECLSQAAILIITAMLLLTVKEKSRIAFLILCILSGIGILIRPANIFLVIPILTGFLVLIFGKRGFLVPAAGCLLFAAICAIPALMIRQHYGIFVWMPSSGYVEIARAVELMQPGDEEAFNDPELRGFCEDMMELKKQYPDADQNTNMWQVAIAAAQARGYDLITCSPLFGKVSRRIFTLHFKEFAAALAGTMKTALERTRLRVGPIPFIGLFLLFTVLFAICVNTDSLLGMEIACQHAVHLCISMTNQPERRYIYSTEILCIIGWLLIMISLTGSKLKSDDENF